MAVFSVAAPIPAFASFYNHCYYLVIGVCLFFIGIVCARDHVCACILLCFV